MSRFTYASRPAIYLFAPRQRGHISSSKSRPGSTPSASDSFTKNARLGFSSATVAWLEAAYARQPEAIDITTRLRHKALGRPYEHAMLLIEAAEEIERLRDEQ